MNWQRLKSLCIIGNGPVRVSTAIPPNEVSFRDPSLIQSWCFSCIAPSFPAFWVSVLVLVFISAAIQTCFTLFVPPENCLVPQADRKCLSWSKEHLGRAWCPNDHTLLQSLQMPIWNLLRVAVHTTSLYVRKENQFHFKYVCKLPWRPQTRPIMIDSYLPVLQLPLATPNIKSWAFNAQHSTLLEPSGQSCSGHTFYLAFILRNKELSLVNVFCMRLKIVESYIQL